MKPPVWALRCDHQASPLRVASPNLAQQTAPAAEWDTPLSPATVGFLSAH